MSDAPRPLPIAHRAARGNRSGVSKYGLAAISGISALTGAARIAPPRVSTAELTERLKKYELATKAGFLQLRLDVRPLSATAAASLGSGTAE